jgi:hypothetical protein
MIPGVGYWSSTSVSVVVLDENGCREMPQTVSEVGPARLTAFID